MDRFESLPVPPIYATIRASQICILYEELYLATKTVQVQKVLRLEGLSLTKIIPPADFRTAFKRHGTTWAGSSPAQRSFGPQRLQQKRLRPYSITLIFSSFPRKNLSDSESFYSDLG
jgi:hypothetical protein